MAETEFARSAENFQYWLANMSDALEDYLETVPASLKNKLDFSETSLRPFEAHLLERFNDVDALLNDDGLDGAAIYTGEAFRKLAGARTQRCGAPPNGSLPPFSGAVSGPEAAGRCPCQTSQA